jgi:outer membrane protein assembly factor BamE
MHNFLKLLLALLLISSAFLTGCGSTVPIVKPFKMDIQQGNVVTSKMLLQLKPGMTKSQVKFIMGTPLIVDSFHTNRWDYFYQMRQAGKIKEQRRVILEFEKELLTRVRGDVVPEGTAGAATGTEAGAATLSKSTEAKSVEPKAKEESLLDKLKFWKKDDKNATAVKLEAKAIAKEAAPAVPTTEAPAIDMSAPDVARPELATPDAQDAPSILAVPIEVSPAVAPPAVEVPTTEAPKAEAKPVLEPAAVASPKVPPIKPVLSKKTLPAPLQIPVATKDEPFIFRMDKNLDLKNLEAAPVEVVPAAETKVESQVKPKKVDVPPPPPEEEPGYFERILEKIGF